MNTENLSTLKIHKLTQAQYDRELEAGRIDPSALYLTPDDTPLGIEYGGTGATNVQNARSNLGLGNVSTENVVPIEKGGTGATTRADILKNLNDIIGTPLRTSINYRYLPDTGLVSSSTTTTNVIANMPNDSTITFSINHDNNSILTDLPIAYGVCVLSKGVNTDFPFGIAINITGGESYILSRKSGIISWTRVLTSVLSASDYGNTLPTPGTPGRIFFLKVSE